MNGSFQEDVNIFLEENLISKTGTWKILDESDTVIGAWNYT